MLENMCLMYEKAFLGGTFDRFHIGHKDLILNAIEIAKYVFVGVVSDELGMKLFKHKELADLIQSYEIRHTVVLEFLKNYNTCFDVNALYDPWGPSIIDPTSNGVLVVSRETRKSADKINAIRQSNNLPILDIVIIPWSYNSKGQQMSSTLRRKIAFSS